MAKKTFKKGLGSLIQDTRHKDEEEESKERMQPVEGDSKTVNDKETSKHIKQLEYHLIQQDRELKQWRTGALTVDKFKKSLDKFNLIYDANSNELKEKGE